MYVTARSIILRLCRICAWTDFTFCCFTMSERPTLMAKLYVHLHTPSRVAGNAPIKHCITMTVRTRRWPGNPRQMSFYNRIQRGLVHTDVWHSDVLTCCEDLRQIWIAQALLSLSLQQERLPAPREYLHILMWVEIDRFENMVGTRSWATLVDNGVIQPCLVLSYSSLSIVDIHILNSRCHPQSSTPELVASFARRRFMYGSRAAVHDVRDVISTLHVAVGPEPP